MKAIRFYAPQDIRYEEVPITPPKAGEVVIKIKAALTCGTDVKTFRRGHPVLIKKIPSGFGHEFSGIIDELGEGVTNFKVGDRVAVANSAPCGECFFCKKGYVNNCTDENGGWALGCRIDGGQAEYVRVPFADQGLMLEEKKKEVEADLEMAIRKGKSCGMTDQELLELFQIVLED